MSQVSHALEDAKTALEGLPALVKATLVSVLALAVVSLAYLLGFLAPITEVAKILFTSLVLSAAMMPLVNYFEGYKVPRWLTILFMYIAAGFMFSLVGSMLVAAVKDQVQHLAGNLHSAPVFWTQIHDFVARFDPGLAEKMNASMQDTVTSISDKVSGWAAEAAKYITSMVSSGVEQTLIVLFVAFFLTVDKRAIRGISERLVPLKHRADFDHAVTDRTAHETAIWARTQLMLAVFAGVASGSALSVVGVPYAWTIGFIWGTLDVIPYVGGFIALALALMIEIQQSGTGALIVIGIYVVILEMEWHVLAPPLMDKYLHIPGWVLILALIFFSQLAGLLGALLAIPLTIMVRAFFDYFYPEQKSPEELARLDAEKERRSHRFRPWRKWIRGWVDKRVAARAERMAAHRAAHAVAVAPAPAAAPPANPRQDGQS